LSTGSECEESHFGDQLVKIYAQPVVSLDTRFALLGISDNTDRPE